MSHTFSVASKSCGMSHTFSVASKSCGMSNPEKVTILYGVNDTVSLDVIKNKNFTVAIRTQYSVTVVRDTDCTQVEKQVNGTMIGLYEFNPNAKGRLIFCILGVHNKCFDFYWTSFFSVYSLVV